jgi:hypothetical protein
MSQSCCFFRVTNLELSAGTSYADGSLIAHNLGCYHRHSFALGGIDFPGHDTTARLVLGQAKFPKSASRAGSEVSNVVGNLHQGARDDVESPVGLHKRIVGG